MMKSATNLLFFFAFLISLSVSEAIYCASPDENTLYVYPSPNNCSYFVACIDFEEYQLDCISAPLFIPWSEESLCLKPCPSVATTRRSTTKISNELPPDPELFPDLPKRTVICPPTGETRAVVAQSCTEYISCDNGIGTKLSCPEGEEFSPTRYQCVQKRISDCPKSKPKGSFHLKCRFARGDDPIYFSSDICPEFLKCANSLAWEVKCAQYCHWNNEHKECDWADNFDCHLTNE